MVSLGYKLASEEHGPSDLARYARRAEETGFEFAMISDHYHPWTSDQGESPFVWGTLGAIAETTDGIEVGTGVTCPTMRVHPVIVAQAAATAATMLEDRFFLGVGTGERLNEHVLGDSWPNHRTRLEMLVEAVDVMRALWDGDLQSHDGEHYTVESAQIFTRPDDPPSIHVAAGGPRTATTAGRIGDGFVGAGPASEHIERFEEAGGEGKPKYAEMAVCWAEDEAEARRTAHEQWPNAAMPGVGSELPTPAHFEQTAEMVSEDDVAEAVVCSPDPADHVEEIETYLDAGYDHICVHQIGPDQVGFFEFYEDEILPEFDG
ncbi:TIGR03557 family F420-dependent LLM class oxidoreductase [Halosimplex rubrum]|uniref:TIGR03557 family F420-dependent LLM class oxidoreductase n=1 Tax=Halosimplex rubrum TaxID=869889 RepID=A0A7D5T7M1_9EURY|nr:TIGR03557 family F420-dependent LLM class oxidoreductase [Halosimplex rubrum]QLH78455.1 TIGR03557 family F420-dependent LLM class oxidoreductase [Halosimplex rubrum]